LVRVIWSRTKKKDTEERNQHRRKINIGLQGDDVVAAVKRGGKEEGRALDLGHNGNRRYITKNQRKEQGGKGRNSRGAKRID